MPEIETYDCPWCDWKAPAPGVFHLHDLIEHCLQERHLFNLNMFYINCPHCLYTFRRDGAPEEDFEEHAFKHWDAIVFEVHKRHLGITTGDRNEKTI